MSSERRSPPQRAGSDRLGGLSGPNYQKPHDAASARAYLRRQLIGRTEGRCDHPGCQYEIHRGGWFYPFPGWWRVVYPVVVFCSAEVYGQPDRRHVIGIHPCGYIEPFCWGYDFAAVEREAKRLPSFVPGSIYVDARPLDEEAE